MKKLGAPVKEVKEKKAVARMSDESQKKGTVSLDDWFY